MSPRILLSRKYSAAAVKALVSSLPPVSLEAFCTQVLISGAFDSLRRMNTDARSLMPRLVGYGKFVLHRVKYLFDIPLIEEEDVL